jgi:hypothetical protein
MSEEFNGRERENSYIYSNKSNGRFYSCLDASNNLSYMLADKKNNSAFSKKTLSNKNNEKQPKIFYIFV